MVVIIQAQPTNKFDNLAWINDDPSSLANKRKVTYSNNNTFHSRRSHKKSRLGCETCKRRHVKCSETRPKCEQCIHQQISCEYTTHTPSETGSDSPSSNDSPWSSAAVSSMATNLAESQLRGIIKPAQLPSRRSSARSSGENMMDILQHFEYVGWSTVGSPDIQSRMRSKVITLSQDSPFLLNAIFAFSANHLHNLKPQDRNVSLAAIHHNQLAVQQYSQELESITPFNLDAMIGACLLVSAMAFNTSDPSPSGSFIFSGPEAATWMSGMSNLGALLRREDTPLKFLAHSIWKPVFQHIVTLPLYHDIQPGSVGLPPLFVSLCNITDLSTPENNPYHAALRLLMSMIFISATPENFSKMINLPCRMTPEFRQLVEEKDPAALLMMGWWFAKMLETELWWCRNRARSECLAVCTYLDGWPDWRVRKLLEWPMGACGYVSIDLEMIGAYVFGM